MTCLLIWRLSLQLIREQDLIPAAPVAPFSLLICLAHSFSSHAVSAAAISEGRKGTQGRMDGRTEGSKVRQIGGLSWPCHVGTEGRTEGQGDSRE